MGALVVSRITLGSMGIVKMAQIEKYHGTHVQMRKERRGDEDDTRIDKVTGSLWRPSLSELMALGCFSTHTHLQIIKIVSPYAAPAATPPVFGMKEDNKKWHQQMKR